MNCEQKMKPEQSRLNSEPKQDPLLTEFQDEIELLLKTDFSYGRNVQQRVRRRLERRWREQSIWSLLWSALGTGFYPRVALASSALIIFAVLNLSGVFALPQHSFQLTPMPVVQSQLAQLTAIWRIERATVTALPADGIVATTTPQILIPQTITPQGSELRLVPTPVPVPVPLIES